MRAWAGPDLGGADAHGVPEGRDPARRDVEEVGVSLEPRRVIPIPDGGARHRDFTPTPICAEINTYSGVSPASRGSG